MYYSLLGPDKVFKIPYRKFSIIKYIQLLVFIRKKRILIVHSHGKGAGIYSRLSKMFLPYLKIIHTYHGIYYENKNPISKFFYLSTERILSLLTDIFICVSNNEKTDAIELKLCNPARTVVIYNGIDRPIICNVNLKKDPQESFVLHISRFDYFKNSRLVIDICEHINLQNPHITFILIGDGPEKHEIEELARARKLNNVLFLGFQQQAGRYFHIADVCLSTSIKEGLPLTLLEALSVGVPIVASDIQGHRELVTPELNGFLFPLENPELASSYILRLTGDDNFHKEMSNNSLTVYRENFQTESMLDHLKKLYQGNQT